MRGKWDFSGYATVNDLKCSDGRTIRRDAFKENDGKIVPLVWQHMHDSPYNVLGHGLLENRKEGVYIYGKFNDTEMGKHAKALVHNGDISCLSIYANQLKQKTGNVLHGVIREVSLVLAGANPGAKIDFPVLEHSDGTEIEEAIIYTNEPISLCHEDGGDDNPESEKEEKEMGEDKEKTLKDVVETMNEEQKNAMYALISLALEDAKNGKEDMEEENKDMKHNVFDNSETMTGDVLSHAEMQTIITDAKRYGSLKDSFLAHSQEYGIENINFLFPNARNITEAPGFIKRNPDGWVQVVMNGVHRTPFARIKMTFANITADEARAKGYIKGKLKKEEVFTLLKRVIEPTTVYKKQKIDRDDLVDIVDFDMVSWLKAEMRMMLDEEIARAIVFGDGRSSMSDDKISESNIIPIVKDADLYTIKKDVVQETGETFEHAFIRAAVESQDDYEGSGNTIAFIANTQVTKLLLMEDKDGHRMYKDINELALALNVGKVVKVPASIVPADMYGVIVDLDDYNVGADKGGAVNMFDDFDIDYNQQKYLIETRCSGGLKKPYSAVLLKKAAA